jgi:hypothetical protein
MACISACELGSSVGLAYVSRVKMGLPCVQGGSPDLRMLQLPVTQPPGQLLRKAL